MGIPEARVVNFEFKPKDVFLTERSVKGKDVMQKIEKIQEKYPDLLILVRNESDETEEFWIN
jgi:hypothetical protein